MRSDLLRLSVASSHHNAGFLTAAGAGLLHHESGSVVRPEMPDPDPSRLPVESQGPVMLAPASLAPAEETRSDATAKALSEKQVPCRSVSKRQRRDGRHH